MDTPFEEAILHDDEEEREEEEEEDEEEGADVEEQEGKMINYNNRKSYKNLFKYLFLIKVKNNLKISVFKIQNFEKILKIVKNMNLNLTMKMIMKKKE